MPDLTTRHLEPELMDSPDIDAVRFLGSLRGLRRVNWVTQSARTLWADVREAARAEGDRPLRVLDVACGGGDVALDLVRKAQRAGVDLDVHGCDIRPAAVDYARAQAVEAGLPVEFFSLDAVRDTLPDGFDVIMCSLFLHHLDGGDAVAFLRHGAAAAKNRLLVHDLVRCAPGYWLAKIGVRALLCNDVCHADGPRSVANAFTLDEVRGLARSAGLNGFAIERRFPYRFLLRWVRS